MRDPRIDFFEKNMRRDPVGHGCHVLPLKDGRFRVVNNGADKSEREFSSGEFSGDSEFEVDRSGKRFVIYPKKLNPDEVVAQESPGTELIPWVPLIYGATIAINASEDPFDIGTIPRNVVTDFRATVEAEPDPLTYLPTYGVGHTYYVEFYVNGSFLNSYNVLAGDYALETGVTVYWPDDTDPAWDYTPELVAYLYDSNGGTLLDTASTFLRTLSPL